MEQPPAPKEHTLLECEIFNTEPSPVTPDSFRKCWARYHPKDQPGREDVKLFTLSRPRISKCKIFFEEDISTLAAPQHIIGIARIYLTQDQKLNFKKTALKKDLIEELFQKRKPEFFLL